MIGIFEAVKSTSHDSAGSRFEMKERRDNSHRLRHRRRRHICDMALGLTKLRVHAPSTSHLELALQPVSRQLYFVSFSIRPDRSGTASLSRSATLSTVMNSKSSRAAAGISRMSASLFAGKITRRIPSVVCVAFNWYYIVCRDRALFYCS